MAGALIRLASWVTTTAARGSGSAGFSALEVLHASRQAYALESAVRIANELASVAVQQVRRGTKPCLAQPDALRGMRSNCIRTMTLIPLLPSSNVSGGALAHAAAVPAHGRCSGPGPAGTACRSGGG